MNPWAIILGLIGVSCIIVAVKGTQDNVISAVTGKHYGSTTLAGGPVFPGTSGLVSTSGVTVQRPGVLQGGTGTNPVAV
jgi:hypothetical protein